MQRIKEELSSLEVNGNLRSIPLIESKSDGKIVIDGVEYVNFASNDYLGVSTKQELIEEFLKEGSAPTPTLPQVEGALRHLFSSASARLLSGSSSEFKELEKTVAELFNKEACLIFNTGYQCNLGVISALNGKGDIVFSDKLNHASIIDGMRLSEGDFIRYKHFDYEHLEHLLQAKRGQYKRAIIVSESVFSMDGDVADIDKLIELKNKYNCLLMIDEAHAFCAYGETLAGVSYGKDVDIITATFGKAVGSFGAFCVANNEIISYLINKARSFIFSTSIPPINIAWTNWLLTEKREYLIEQKQKLTNLIHEINKSCILPLQGGGWGLSSNNTHILPIIIGSNEATLKVAEELKSMGYYIPAIRPPTVPEGTSRLRLSLTADTKLDDVKAVLKIATSSHHPL